MKQRLSSLAVCILLVLSLVLSACGSAADPDVHAPILPASARGQSQTAPQLQPTETTAPAEASSSLEDQCAAAVLAFEESFTLTVGTAEEALDAFHAMFDHHPEFFWLTGGYVYYDKTSTGENSVEIVPNLLMPLEEAKAARQSLDKAVSAILSGIDSGMSDFEKALYLHDSIVGATDYDYDTYERMMQDETFLHTSQTAYGCLVEHKAVCAGYSAAYQLLMQRAGIPCIRVDGTATGGPHEWNLITLDGDPYYVDVTWDDPRPTDNGAVPETHEFFCITTAELFETHSVDADVSVPLCTATKYDYYRYFDQYMETYDRAEFARRLRNAQDSVSVRFGSIAAAAEAERDLSGPGVIFSMDDSLQSVLIWHKDDSRTVTCTFSRQ